MGKGLRDKYSGKRNKLRGRKDGLRESNAECVSRMQNKEMSV